MQVNPMSSAGGAIIEGIDLSEPLPENIQSDLMAAFIKYSVLVIKKQNISEEDQFRFCEIMGGLGVRGKPLGMRENDLDSEYEGAIHLVTNLTEDGKALGSFGDGEVWFHHDGIFKEIPDAATVLYALAVTSTGGETVFANMYKAYEKLDPELKCKIASLNGLNVYDYGSRGRVDLNQDYSKLNQCVHPLIIRHPKTKKRALYVNPLMTARIVGLSERESDELLELLFQYKDDAELLFQHKWEVGDVVIMDNQSLTHARNDFPAGEPRMLRRTLVKGVPISR
tara:strand:- start:243 stop:1088 length:846 start_codon:yes stop_codon:yes gene_type:complete